MKVTVALLANTATHNDFGSLLQKAEVYECHGMQAAQLPFHAGLRPIFDIPDSELLKEWMQKTAVSHDPIAVSFEEMSLSEIPIGEGTGALGITIKSTPVLRSIRDSLNQFLFEKYHLDKPAGDLNEWHMTFSLFGGSTEAYRKAYKYLKYMIPEKGVLTKIALFYYDDEGLVAGHYFCPYQLRLKSEICGG